MAARGDFIPMDAIYLVDSCGRDGACRWLADFRAGTLPNISMVFLMAVLFSAVSFGTWPAIYASLLSFLAYNFFFIEPLYTFQIAEAHELLALLVFLIVAIVTSTLAGRVRDQMRAANERADHAPPV